MDAEKAGGFPLTIELAEPLTHGGVTITKVVIREPKGRDWKRWAHAEDGPKRTMGLLSDLTGLEETAFDEMAMRDHVRCVEAANAFFARYQPEESGLMKLLLTSPSVSAGLAEMLKG